MREFFQTLLQTSFHGSIVILAVLLARLVLKKAPKKYICMMWMLAGIRLLLPIPLESSFSLQPPAIQIPLSVSLGAILPIVWVFMAAFIGLYSLGSYIHLRRQVMDAVKIPGGWESDRIETAFVLGFIKPKIYIPTGMSQQTRTQILAHERTHLDKGDHWIKMIGFLALALHWFNPLVWVSYILLCKDIEMACDERVVQFMELEERKAYSSALLRCSTNRAHYAACPVAFGEISVKYRIKSILNYRKPSFWLSLLAVLAFCFVGICLMTSPKTVVEVPVDADKPLRDISQEDPAAFTPAVLPETEENPDWGIEVYLDCTSPTGGTLIYRVEDRFVQASPSVEMRDGSLERWNGSQWEAVPSNSENTALFEQFGIGFAIRRDRAVNYFTEELDWTLKYGALSAGDYRICQTIHSATDSATFRTVFHVYREKLPTEQEAALERCENALSDLMNNDGYSVLLSSSALDGEIYPVKRITYTGSLRLDHYVGDALISSARILGEEAPLLADGWDQGFHVNQNRRFLFPEGKSLISQEEITFCSVWSDFAGNTFQGKDTYRFLPDGRFRSAERTVQTMDGGTVVSEDTIRLEMILPQEISPLSDKFGAYSDYINSIGNFATQDSFDAKDDSPWGVFFRVDDDLLGPGGGEVWLAIDTVGVSNYTTDGTYWLEKKNGNSWQRLGGETTTASWGEETITLKSRTSVTQVDWTDTYGSLDAGIYRMGKQFRNGDDSIIQYAEFAIYQAGGVFGEGGEEALARVDAAIEKLHNSNYRVEEYNYSYSTYDDRTVLSSVLWKYDGTEVRDYYNDVERYSHSVATQPGGFGYGDWLKRSYYESDYDSIYFPAGYGLISDREIRLVYSWSSDSSMNPSELYTYRFDEEGNLTEIIKENVDGLWGGFVTRYVVTDTPESEIKAWVEAKQAEQ